MGLLGYLFKFVFIAGLVSAVGLGVLSQKAPQLFQEGVVPFATNIIRNFVHNLAQGTSTPERVLRYVYANAEKGNPESVMNAIDEFAWNQAWMMNVGDAKGKVLDDAVKGLAENPVVLELGTFCGYSGVRIGRFLKQKNGFLYTVDIDPMHSAVATKNLEFAGLYPGTVSAIVGYPQDVIRQIHEEHPDLQFDLVFLDHEKSFYETDLQLVLELDMLADGGVVVADNILFPGAPEYINYIRNHPDFTSEFFESHLEYQKGVKDGVEVSVYKAKSN
eukprot:Rmarinus@m.26212